jgi:hypothetical protein
MHGGTRRHEKPFIGCVTGVTPRVFRSVHPRMGEMAGTVFSHASPRTASALSSAGAVSFGPPTEAVLIQRDCKG